MKQLKTNIRDSLLSFSIILIFSISTPIVSTAAAATKSGGAKQSQHVPDQILVRFKPGASAATKAAAHGKNKPTSEHGFKHFDGLKLFKLAPGLDVNTAIEHYKKNPNVLYAEPDNIVGLDSTNDTSFTELWGLNNTGQTVNGTSGTNDADMNVVEAWSNSGVTGSNSVVIGVIDSGVQYTHPDLATNMWVNPGEIAGNGIDDDSNGYIDDVYGINAITNSGDPMDDNNHGTHVAGTIAATGNNAQGITGVNQQAKILACKFLNAAGSGSSSDSLKCLDYIYDLKMSGINIVVTNNSWGGTGGGSQAVADAIDKHRQAGILFIAAAGNSGTDNDTGPHYPSNYFKANVISVAATDQNDAKASFSNYGRRSVHVGAPGVNIYSSIVGSTYSHFQGTSMAAPHVAGLAALLSAEDPGRDWKTIKNLIVSSGTELGALSTNTSTGRRIRAWDSDGTGAMTCSNQTVTSVLYPQVSSSTRIGGTKLGLAAMNINCASGAGTVSVTTTGPEAVGVVTLQDNGLEFDEAASDGIYSAYWTAPATTGTYTLTFSNGQTQSVNVIANTSTLQSYRSPVEISYNPRVNAGSAFSQVPDNAYLFINGYTAYYQLPIGGVNSTNIYAIPQGGNLLNAPTGAQLTGVNTPLANDIFETLFTGYWDDLDVYTAGYGVRAWWSYNSGATPVGEAVFEWKARHKTTGNLIQFQIVYTANSSDIEVHYVATDNNGESATVGMQVDWVRAAEQNFNVVNPDLAAGKAWKWSLDSGAPTANAGTDQNVAGNSLVTLSGSASDPDGGSLNYNWSQTAGTLVTISDADTLSPTFYAPNTTETLTFKLTVTDDSGQSTNDSVNVNVTASAPAGSLQFNSTTYSVNENDGSASITVTRTGGSAGIIGVSFSSGDNTASSPGDYTYTSGSLTWSDGDTANKTITIPIVNDTTIEANETVSLFLLNPTGGSTLGTKNAILSIVNDDAPGTLSFSSTTYSVSENGVNATVTVSRTSGASGAVSVNYSTANGTATAGSDYASASGTLSWTNGDSANKTFSVDVTDDAAIEGNETVTLSLSGETGSATLGTSSATLSIVDNDIPSSGTLSLSSATYSVNENGSSVSIVVTRSGGSSGVVGISYSSADATATTSDDYTGVSGTLSWSDGDTANKSFIVNISDNSIYEVDETFAINLSSATGGATISTAAATVTIIDNDTAIPGTLSVTDSVLSVNENGVSLTASVSRTGGSDGTASVVYASVNETATAGEDYSSVSGSLSWGHGDSATKTIIVSITDDDVYEGNETFVIGLSGVSGATLGSADVDVTITDDDAAPVPPAYGTIALSASNYDADENSGTATVTISRTGGSDGAVSIEFSIDENTATLVEDFTTTSGTLSWADGDSTEKTFSVILLDDQLYEGDEMISITLSNIVGSATLGNASGTITIVDDELAPVAENQPPQPPTLIAPANNSSTVSPGLVSFEWNAVTDPSGYKVTYMLEYCNNADFTNCDTTQTAQLKMSSSTLLAGLGGGAGAGLALFGLVGTPTRRQRYIRGAALIIVSLIISACGTNIPLPGEDGTLSQLVTNLNSNTTYYWKVTATNSSGLSSVSEVWSFTTL